MRNEQHEEDELKAMIRLTWTILIVFVLSVITFVIIVASFRTKPQKPHIDKISPAYKIIENVEQNGDTTDIFTFYPDKLCQ